MATIKKNLFHTFIAAIITGFIGQSLIPLLSANFVFSYWDFSVLISNIDIYPLVITLMICLPNKGPKHVLFRIFIYFIGLCIGYYGWTSGLDIYHCIVQSEIRYLYNILSDLQDSAVWITLGLLAGIWGYFTIKFESKRTLFYVLMAPFGIVEILSIYDNLTCMTANIIMSIVDVLCLIGIFIVIRQRTKIYNTNISLKS